MRESLEGALARVGKGNEELRRKRRRALKVKVNSDPGSSSRWLELWVDRSGGGVTVDFEVCSHSLDFFSNQLRFSS